MITPARFAAIAGVIRFVIVGTLGAGVEGFGVVARPCE